jgi:Cupin-like domain
MNDWKAGSAWSFESLKSRFGETTILVYGYDKGSYQQDLIRRIPLGDYIDKILVNDFESYPYYGRDNYSLFVEHKDLRSDFTEPKYCYDWFRVVFPGFALRPGPRIFVGPKGCVTNLHQDMWSTHFWMAHVVGRKQWVLFSPDQKKLLYTHCRQIRPDKPDLDRFPMFAKARGLEAVVNPGELIIVPRDWLHFVVSLDPTVSLTHNYMGPGNFLPCLKGQLGWTIGELVRSFRERTASTA